RLTAEECRMNSSRQILNHYAECYHLDEPLRCWEETSLRHDALAYYVRTLTWARRPFFAFLRERFGRPVHPHLAPEEALQLCGPLNPTEEDETILDFVDHCQSRVVLRDFAQRLGLWCQKVQGESQVASKHSPYPLEPEERTPPATRQTEPGDPVGHRVLPHPE